MNKLLMAPEICVLCLLLVSACSSQTSPIEKVIRISPQLAEDQIRAEVLKHTPFGASADQVLGFARSQLKHIGAEPTYEQAPARGRRAPAGPVVRVGVRSLSVCLGEYGFPGRRGTFVSWGLDEHDKLIDVIVEKERDSL